MVDAPGRFFRTPPAGVAAHLEALRNGSEAWRAWRLANPNTKADFRGLTLRDINANGADLRGADFRDAQLFQCDFSGADLRDCDFTSEKPRQACTIIGGGRLAQSIPDHRMGVRFGGSSLSGANLSGAQMESAHLFGCDMSGCKLVGADLRRADLSRAVLHSADLQRANLDDATLEAATLCGADLTDASLQRAVLTGADLGHAESVNMKYDLTVVAHKHLPTRLIRANLEGASLRNTLLVGTDLGGAKLKGCFVYGVSAWQLNLAGADQSDLVVTPPWEPRVVTDRLDMAQFICLLIDNKNIRQLIDTAVAKLVLVLGRFSPERKAVLDRVRVELRAKGYVPVVFDFEGPSTRDTTETVSTLAHLARFVIADLSDPRCVQHELNQIVPYLPSVPVALIVDAGQTPYAMVDHWAPYPWVLDTYAYENADALIADLDTKIVGPAEAKWLERHAPG